MVFLPFLCGKNPKKENSSVGKPDCIKAGMIEVAPGKQNILILFSFALLTNKYPGSLIPGVPASEIRAILLFFSFISLTNDSTILCSLCW